MCGEGIHVGRSVHFGLNQANSGRGTGAPGIPAGLHLEAGAGQELRPFSVPKVPNWPFSHLEDLHSPAITRSITTHGEFLFPLDPRRSTATDEYLRTV